MGFPWLFAARAAKINSSAIRDLLKLTEKPGIISFAGGLPAAAAFPTEEIADACKRVLRDDGTRALQYSATEGYAPLREMVAEGLDWKVDPAHILITTGSQQGLDLLAKVLVDKGDRVLVESPTYLGALQAFMPMEPQIEALACDDEGLLPEALQTAVKGGTPAKFVYLQPNFQNPTGRSMSIGRRAAIAEAAQAVDVPIIEDNPYGDLWFDLPPPPSLASLNPQSSVYLGSFSKVLAPGLRLGYLVAPPPIYDKLVHAKQGADLQSATFSQRIVAELLKDGFLPRHVPKIRALYQKQRDAMLAALARETHQDPMDGAGVSWNVPAGGMFLWLKLPQGMDATELLPLAIRQGVAFVPGAPFFNGEADRRTVRLSYVTASVEDIDRGISILAKVIRSAQVG